MASLTALLSTLLTSQLPSSSPTPPSLRLQTLTLFASLPRPSLPLLALFASAYQSTNASLVQKVFTSALEGDEELLGEIEDVAIGSLESDLLLVLSPDRVRMYLSLARSCEEVSSLYGQSVGVVRNLEGWWEMSECRDEVVDTLFVVLRCAFLDPVKAEEGDERDAFWEEMEDVVSGCREDASASGSEGLAKGQGMWEDLERRFGVSGMIEELAGQSEIARELAQTFRSFSSSTSSSPDDIELQISQILDVLPTFSPLFLRSCLLHPHFTRTPSLSTSELVLGALLEGASLPLELENMRDGIEPASTPDGKGKGKERVFDKAKKTNTRHNIYDDQRITADKLLRPNAAPSTVMGVSTDNTLRDLIIARAEAPSSDSEDEGETGEAFLEDFEDRTRAFRMTPDWGDEDSGTVTPEKRESSSPITPALASILEQTYLEDPFIFNADSATRKSKKRIALREVTKLDDGILEGWRIMLERSEKKDKILEKHSFMNSFTGNEQGLFIPGTTGSHRGRGGGRGGGTGGDRGGGAGRGRGDGGRKAHDRRQRGNDRKQPKI